MVHKTRRSVNTRRESLEFSNEDTKKIVSRVASDTQDELLAHSLSFSPTALSHIRRIISAGGSIITDTQLLADSLDAALISGTQAKVKCFIDEPFVIADAEKRRATRAEVAVDMALSEQGAKLFVMGSAPSALGRLLLHRRHEPLTDVCVLCTVNGFAGVLQLKEKLRESDMAYIMTRGRNGSTQAAVTVLEDIIKVLQGK